MSKGIITANLGKSKYRVRLVYDYASWQKKLDIAVLSESTSQQAMTALDVPLSKLINIEDAARATLNDAVAADSDTDFINALVKALNKAAKNHAAMRLDYNRLKAEKLAAQKLQRWLVSNKKPDNYSVDCYCIDYDLSLPVGMAVGMLEINNENPTKQDYYIHPNRTHTLEIGTAAFDAKRDGNMTGATGMDGAQLYYNLAMFTGWQRWRPLYRLAKVTAFYSNTRTIDVSLYAATSSHQPEGKTIDINSSSNSTVALSSRNIPVWAANAGGTVKVGDDVVIKYLKQNPATPVAIGLIGGTNGAPSSGSVKAMLILDSPNPIGFANSTLWSKQVHVFDTIQSCALVVSQGANGTYITSQELAPSGAATIFSGAVPFTCKYAFAVAGGVLLDLDNMVRFSATGTMTTSKVNATALDVLYAPTAPRRAVVTPSFTSVVIAGLYGVKGGDWIQQGNNNYARIVSCTNTVVTQIFDGPDPDGTNASIWEIFYTDYIAYFEETVSNGAYSATRIGTDYQLSKNSLAYKIFPDGTIMSLGLNSITDPNQPPNTATLALVDAAQLVIDARCGIYDRALMPTVSGDASYPLLKSPPRIGQGIYHAYVYEPISRDPITFKINAWRLYVNNYVISATEYYITIYGVGSVTTNATRGAAFDISNGTPQIMPIEAPNGHVTLEASLLTWQLLGRAPLLDPTAPDTRL